MKNDFEKSKFLSLYPIDYPFESLVSRVKDGKLTLDPDFQRRYKWDKNGHARGSKFIESCLMRIPLPACYFAEDQDGRQLVIDGVQRITTICKFFDNEFPLEGLSVFSELNGKTFSEIGNYKNELESTTIRCVILRKENPQELIREIFARLNQGSVILSSQEIRHAIFPGLLDSLLQELASLGEIRKFKIGDASQKIKDAREDEELVLRFFAMDSPLNDYDDNLSHYMDKYMEQNQNIDKIKVEQLKLKFEKALNNCVSIFKENVFINPAKRRARQSIAFYDLLMWSFSQYTNDTLLRKRDIILRALQEICETSEFNRTLAGRLQSKSSILKRRKLWQAKLDSAL